MAAASQHSSCRRPCRLSAVLAMLVSLGSLGPSRPACARPPRPRFEPTDLEMEPPGVLDIDLQFGYAQGPATSRVLLPDFELDIGVTRFLEIDLDGSLWLEAADLGHLGPGEGARLENLWLSAKLGLLGGVAQKEGAGRWGLGLQVGPRLPTAAGAGSVGGELLVLFGHSLGESHAVFNLGGFIDPEVDGGRAAGLQLGADLDLALPGPLSLQAEISGVYSLSRDPSQVLLSLGLTWAQSAYLDLSCTALFGVLATDDRFAVLLGISPKVPLLRRRQRPGGQDPAAGR